MPQKGRSAWLETLFPNGGSLRARRRARVAVSLITGLALLTFSGAGGAQGAFVEVRQAKATVVERQGTGGPWLLEFDRSVLTAAGHLRDVRLDLDETRASARPLKAGDRLSVDGRLILPALIDASAILQPARIEFLDGPGLRHAYYLFRGGQAEVCSACYVPLLLTREPLTVAGPGDDAEIIVTYERDSIWQIRDEPGRVTEIATAPPTLRFEQQLYRYQEVPLSEAIRLLSHPLGSIPISRPFLKDAPTEMRLQALLLRLTHS
jgi:hypothetical protein